MKHKVSLLIVLLVVFSLGFYCIHKIQKESDYISHFHSIYLPEISTTSFLIGCLYGSENNIELCEQAALAFEHDAKKMLELSE